MLAQHFGAASCLQNHGPGNLGSLRRWNALACTRTTTKGPWGRRLSPQVAGKIKLSTGVVAEEDGVEAPP